MPQFKIILTTVADLVAEIEADSEDAALHVAHERAAEFANQVHAGVGYIVSINDAWDLRDPEVEQS